MIRKTFTTKPEATKYQNEMTDNRHIAVLGALGDKFRVYVETKEETERMASWRSKLWTKENSERYLRRIAGEERDAIDDAVRLQQVMADDSLYNDYESIIEAARIMEKYKELKYASDVFNFIDHTEKYEKALKSIIEDNFEQYDYEGKEKVRAE